MITRDLQLELLIMLASLLMVEICEVHLRHSLSKTRLKGQLHKITIHSIPIARTFCDECFFGDRSSIVYILDKLKVKACWRPAYWFLSAIPCPFSPYNI